MKKWISAAFSIGLLIILCECNGLMDNGKGGDEKVANPSFDPAPGSYESTVSVTISCDTPDSSIYYTTDGTNPTVPTAPATTSTRYTGAIFISSTTTLKAIAVKLNLQQSEVVSATYTITQPKAATPSFDPEPGVYDSAQSVTLSCATSKATIHYTTDGTNPTATSTQYTGAIPISSDTTIKAIAIKAGIDDSDIATGFFDINILHGGAVQGNPLALTGRVSTFASSLRSGFNKPAGITSDGTNLYVVDETNRVRQVSMATAKVTTIAGSMTGDAGAVDGMGKAARFNNPLGITTDGTNLYIADTGNHTLRKVVITTGVVTTIAGSGISGADEGIGAAASFNRPVGIATDGINLYVADSLNHKIRKVVIATGEVTTLAGSGAAGYADGTGTSAEFNTPNGITLDGTYLYITDYGNHNIRNVEIATGTVGTLAGSWIAGADDGVGTAASFSSPAGITTDGTNLYVADVGNHKVRMVVIETGEVTTIAGSGTAGAVDGTGMAASFNLPFGITYQGTSLYMTDTLNYKIRKVETATAAVTTVIDTGLALGIDDPEILTIFEQLYGIATDGTSLFLTEVSDHSIHAINIETGVLTTVAGSGFEGAEDGVGTEASFKMPAGVTTDGINLYVADTFNHKIRRVAVATGEVITLAGTWFPSAEDGPGLTAGFNQPSDITTDGVSLYVADTYNRKIRKVALATGEVSTVAGSGTEGNVDGIGSEASFNWPVGITTDGVYLYVADAGNHNVRKIVIATGEVTTLAGSGTEGSSDGIGAEASFNAPAGITTDGTNLFVADTGNCKIRKMVISTGEVTSIAGSASHTAVDDTGAAAGFFAPVRITTDGTSLYIIDNWPGGDITNTTIRRVD